jgi:hypothetical protein
LCFLIEVCENISNKRSEMNFCCIVRVFNKKRVANLLSLNAKRFFY